MNQVFINQPRETRQGDREDNVRPNEETPARWQTLAFVAGNGTTDIPQDYHYTTEGLAPGLYDFRLKQIDFDGTFTYTEPIRVVFQTSGEVILHANYPNPFNPVTQIRFELPLSTDVNLSVYDVTGRQVAVLVDGPMQSGRHSVSFDGLHLSSGTYFYQLQTGDIRITKPMTLTK